MPTDIKEQKQKLRNLVDVLEGMSHENFFPEDIKSGFNQIYVFTGACMLELGGTNKYGYERDKRQLEELLQMQLKRLPGKAYEGKPEYRSLYEQWKITLNDNKDFFDPETQQKIEEYLTEETRIENERAATDKEKDENERIKKAAKDTVSRWVDPRKVEYTEEVKQKIDDAWKQIKDNSILFRGSKEYKEMYTAMKNLHETAEKEEKRRKEGKEGKDVSQKLSEQLKAVQRKSLAYLQKKSIDSFYDPNAEKTLATKGVGEERYKAAQKAFRLLEDILNKDVKEPVQQEQKKEARVPESKRPENVQPKEETKLNGLMVQWGRQMETIKDALPGQSPLRQNADNVKKSLFMAQKEKRYTMSAVKAIDKMKNQMTEPGTNVPAEDIKQMGETLSEIKQELGKSLSPDEKKKIEELEQMPLENNTKAKERKSLQAQVKQEKAMGK